MAGTTTLVTGLPPSHARIRFAPKIMMSVPTHPTKPKLSSSRRNVRYAGADETVSTGLDRCTVLTRPDLT